MKYIFVISVIYKIETLESWIKKIKKETNLTFNFSITFFNLTFNSINFIIN